MNGRTVFAYNLTEFIREIAKKGTESDITIYSRKEGDEVTTIISPSRFPEKVSSLTDSIYPSDYALINGDNLNRDLGEVIVAVDLAGIRRGAFVFSNQENIDRIKPLIANTSLRNFTTFTGTAMEFKDILTSEKAVERFRTTTVVIDHFFKVRSVGTVALGFVLGGKISKHQKLHCTFTDAEVQVRSIQVQDIEQEEAETGARVGLALKNIDSEEMERGMFLTEEPQETFREKKAEFIPYPSLKRKWEGGELFVADLMRYQRGNYQDGQIQLDRPFPGISRDLIAVSPNATPRILGNFRV